MKKLLLALFVTLWASTAWAEIWINPGFYSYHFERDKGFNNVNTGLGLEVYLTDNYSLTAGFFENSDRATSRYVGLYAMPFKIGGFKLGTAVGAFDGYPRVRQGGWFPALIPTAAFEGKQFGLNVGFVPTIGDRLHGALTFQVKYNLLP